MVAPQDVDMDNQAHFRPLDLEMNFTRRYGPSNPAYGRLHFAVAPGIQMRTPTVRCVPLDARYGVASLGEAREDRNLNAHDVWWHWDVHKDSHALLRRRMSGIWTPMLGCVVKKRAQILPTKTLFWQKLYLKTPQSVSKTPPKDQKLPCGVFSCKRWGLCRKVLVNFEFFW